MDKIINGKVLSQKIKGDLKEKINKLDKKPGLAVILIGDNPASQVYVKNKEKACNEVGIYSKTYKLSNDIQEEEVMKLIDELNNDSNINGILIQLPLPSHLNAEKLINKINPLKDVDGFTYVNAGKLLTGRPDLIPCTPAGCIELIKSTGEEIQGKHAVIVGRSNIVGKPIAILLMKENATITICHSKTKNLEEITKTADILIVSVGKPLFIKENMVKKDSIIIDVGINKIDGKLKGDVDFDNVLNKAKFITPVPGGVGPMTIAMLMKNTYTAYLLQQERNK